MRNAPTGAHLTMHATGTYFGYTDGTESLLPTPPIKCSTQQGYCLLE